jgi:hypothetical protein
MDSRRIRVNRAPVLTLWAAVVAERLGFGADEALTLGRAVAGMSAQIKARSLGMAEPEPRTVEERRRTARPGDTGEVRVLGRAVPVIHTDEGIRAVDHDKPGSPAGVRRYLEAKFGAALPEVRAAMAQLADALPPAELDRRGFHLYEVFRPEIPAGVSGWGAAGELDLGRILDLRDRVAGTTP